MAIKSTKQGLNKLIKNAEEMDGKQQVKLVDLMTPEFITGCSNFNDLESLFSQSTFKIENIEDFKAIPEHEWEDFINKHTSFRSWEEMQKNALEAYVKRQLFKGL